MIEGSKDYLLFWEAASVYIAEGLPVPFSGKANGLIRLSFELLRVSQYMDVQ